MAGTAAMARSKRAAAKIMINWLILFA